VIVGEKLPKSFYIRDDVLQIAHDLIGKVLYTNLNGQITSGIIVEAEAYNGRNDPGCHAYPEKHTPRTEVMYEEGGVAYVYLCYGIHRMFNVVTNVKGKADCVLIRAVEPLNGMDVMLLRREKKKADHRLTMGPGSVGKALGITLEMNGNSLLSNSIWIASNNKASKNQIVNGPRVGMSRPHQPYAKFPWRFYVADSPWVSKYR